MTVDLIFMLKQMYKLFEIGCDVLSLQATDLSCRQTRCQKEIDRKLGLLCGARDAVLFAMVFS